MMVDGQKWIGKVGNMDNQKQERLKERSEEGIKISLMRRGIIPARGTNWLQKWWV